MRAALDTFLRRVAARLGERVRTDAVALQAASADASHVEPSLPAAVLQARDTAEVSLICREAADLHIGLVPRGAGTGKAGGCIAPAEAVVVDVSAMASIAQLRPADLFAVVGPGVVTAHLDAAAGEHGLMYPPDPASWESCSLGGNVATNAGGPRAVKYGVTGRYVWGLQAVLAGGEVLNMGRKSIKGVAGLNLTGLFVGSEGTLGFITEITLHLVPAPRGVQTAWLGFDSPKQASVAAARIFAAGMLPRMLELLDAPALQAVRPLVQWPMPQTRAALLVEVDGASDALALDELTRLCDAAAPPTSAIAANEADREAMRRTRRLVSSSLKKHYPFKVSDDIAVPRSAMPALLDEAQEAAAAAGLAASAYGHLGDGNLHINLLCKTAAQRQASEAVRLRLYRFAVSLGGTVSGEHGVGLAKRAALGIEQPEGLLAAQRRIKAALDPTGIINPGKVFAAPLTYSE